MNILRYKGCPPRYPCHITSKTSASYYRAVAAHAEMLAKTAIKRQSAVWNDVAERAKCNK